MHDWTRAYGEIPRQMPSGQTGWRRYQLGIFQWQMSVLEGPRELLRGRLQMKTWCQLYQKWSANLLLRRSARAIVHQLMLNSILQTHWFSIELMAEILVCCSSLNGPMARLRHGSQLILFEIFLKLNIFLGCWAIIAPCHHYSVSHGNSDLSHPPRWWGQLFFLARSRAFKNPSRHSKRSPTRGSQF